MGFTMKEKKKNKGSGYGWLVEFVGSCLDMGKTGHLEKITWPRDAQTDGDNWPPTHYRQDKHARGRNQKWR